jgi:membrane fusion protein, peptide pheromone/bacteriocin exporter
MNTRPELKRLYCGPYALTCAESLLATRGRNRPYVYRAALAMCASALIALPIVHVDVTVQERGRVRPAVERSAIVSRTAGYVSSVRARDNDLVRAGDILLTLHSQGLQAKRDFNATQLEVVSKELADLHWLLDRVSNNRPVSLSDLQTSRYVAQYQEFDTRCRNASLKVDRTYREMSRTKQLLASKAVASRELDESSYQANEARVEFEVIYRETIARWQGDKVQKESHLEQLKAEARQLEDEANLYCVKAPVDGTIIGFNGVVEGSYVQSGERIGDISPTSDFVLDVSVPPRDIGRIFQGQTVKIQVDAYPYTVWGLLPGRVEAISADYLQERDNKGSGAFKVIVRPDRDYLETRDGLTGTLKKGMTVTARFFVARRSLWELAYEDMDRIFNPARKPDVSEANHPQ